uniref:Uncharacterized protein n=1 Tax=Arundo donax TaxID=35708 RepID=A0A0A9HET7_ARUDO
MSLQLKMRGSRHWWPLLRKNFRKQKRSSMKQTKSGKNYSIKPRMQSQR